MPVTADYFQSADGTIHEDIIHFAITSPFTHWDQYTRGVDEVVRKLRATDAAYIIVTANTPSPRQDALSNLRAALNRTADEPSMQMGYMVFPEDQKMLVMAKALIEMIYRIQGIRMAKWQMVVTKEQALDKIAAHKQQSSV